MSDCFRYRNERMNEQTDERTNRNDEFGCDDWECEKMQFMLNMELSTCTGFFWFFFFSFNKTQKYATIFIYKTTSTFLIYRIASYNTWMTVWNEAKQSENKRKKKTDLIRFIIKWQHFQFDFISTNHSWILWLESMYVTN